MPQRLTCPRGHHWEIPDAGTDTPRELPMHCPVCGTLADTLGEKRASPPSTSDSTPEIPSSGESIPPTHDLPPGRLSPVIREQVVLVDVPGYEVLGELGRGGAGVVYQARQLALDRLVALKVLASGPHAGPDELARFRSEAEAVARLQHPHIVHIYEVGQANGRPYFALEYLSGGSLAAKLLGQPQPPRQAAEMVRTLARAVHYAHQNGILHRDLKPGNVLLDADGAPKVADFGLAKRLDLDPAALQARHTPTGAILGTPSYMAPEQAGGASDQLGPAVDVHALGALLYEMLTGRPPFLSESLTNTLLQVLEAEPVAPRRLNPRVPRDLETIALRCLEKKPAGRYASAAALADDLERFLDDRPIQARPVGRLERALKWARRRPAQAALLIVSTLALLLGAAGVAWHQIALQSKNVALAQALGAEETQRRRNVQLLRTALEVESGYGSYLDDQLKPLPHLTRLRSQLLEKRLRFYQPILDQEPDDPEMRQTQALSYLEMGIIQQRLGKTPEAEKAYQAAIERLEELPNQESPAGRRVLASACVQYGMLRSGQGHDAEAADLLERGEHLLDQLVADDPAVENRHALALACHNRALFLSKKRQFEPARRNYEHAIALRKQLIEDDPHEDRYPRELAGSYANLGALYLGKDQLERARAELDRAANLMRQQPLDVEDRYLLAGIYLNLGIGERQHKPQQAIEDFQKALGLWSDLLAEFPVVPDYRRRAASAQFLLGLQYESVGQLPKAQHALRQYLELSRQVHRAEPDAPASLHDVTEGLYQLGRLLRASRQNDEAQELWREEQALLDQRVREQPNQASAHRDLSYVLGQLGDLDRERGLQGRFAPGWPLLPVQPHVGVPLHNLVLLSMSPAYQSRAADAYRQGIREQRLVLKLGRPQPMDYIVLDRHAQFLALVAMERGRYEDMADAAAGAEEAARGLSAQPDGGRRYLQAAAHTASCVTLVRNAGALSAAEKTARARQHADRAVELLTKAVAAGFRNTALLEQARELAPLRGRPDFQKLVKELKGKKR